MVVDYSKWDNLSVYSSSSSSDGDEDGQEEEEEEEEEPPPSPLLALPHALWALIFARLPTDARLRCAAVCRAWRATMHAAAPEVWTELWFAPDDGYLPRLTDDCLVAAAALAQGRLRVLNLSVARGRVLEPALLRVLAANGATLRELHLPPTTLGMRFPLSPGLHQRIMAAAPVLRLLSAGTLGNMHEGTPAGQAARLLRRPNVRVRRLHVSCFRADADDMAALTRALAKRGALLRELHVKSAAVGALDVLLGAACAHCSFECVCFQNCALGPAALPALARLLRGGALVELEVWHNARYTPPTALLGGDDEEEEEEEEEDEEDEEEEEAEQEAGGGIGIGIGAGGAGGAGNGGGGGGGIGVGGGFVGAPAVADDVMSDFAASFTSPTCALSSLSVNSSLLFRVPAAAAALLAALTGHPRLATLHLSGNRVSSDAQRAAAGAALGALLAANAPALTDLDVSSCNLGDEGLGPLFEALPRNTHLRVLEADGNAPTRAFLRGRVLPALRANASLRKARVVAEAMP
jgi:hypothetical protein